MPIMVGAARAALLPRRKALRLWNGKFVAGLTFIVLFVVNARWNPKNETTGRRPPLLGFTDEGIFPTVFSFLFLLVFLFAVSHAGSWVLWKFRRHGDDTAEQPAPAKGKKKKRKRR